MNKKILFVSLALITVIGAGFIYLLSSDQDTKSMNDMSKELTESQANSLATEAPVDMPTEMAPVQEETKAPVATTPAPTAGSYVGYSSDVISKTSGTKLLFFHAPWCPQCRALESDIEKSGVPAGVTIIKIDYDSNQSLRRQYGVTLQTTIVKVDDNGTLVKKFVAYDDPTVASIKANLL